jgi:antitoxin CptB
MSEDAIHRLRWRCRRGLLELDLLLETFLETSYSIISDEEKRAFEALLHHSDPELWRYCFEENPHPDPLIADVIANIRRTASP